MGLIALPAARRSRSFLVCSGLALALMLLLGPAGALAATGRRIGTRPSLPSGARAVGALSQSTPLSVTVTLQPRDPGALAAYAAAVSTPGSDEYHNYLSVSEFARRFGPTPAAIAAAEASLRARGLRPGRLSANGLSFLVTATAGRLASGFQTGFERYHLRSGRTAFANTSAPEVTGSGASVIQSVLGLSNLAVAKPEGITGTAPASASGSTVSHTVTTSGVTACSTATEDGEGSYTADQIASAYGFDGLYGAGDTGTGVTVALYELEPYTASDVSSYQACYGTSVPIAKVNVDGGASCNGDQECGIEDVLDIEDVIGLAPGVHVSVYEGPNSSSGGYDTYAQIVSDDTAKVISTSWGLCEAEEGTDAADAENTLFQEAAAQGQSVFAAAGDSGADDCGTGSGQTVDDPASQPYVTGVGGTSLSSVSPLSETVWNDGGDVGAGGGGVSQLWSQPSYQSGFALAQSAITCGSGGDVCREVPDVSAEADEFPGYDVYWDGSWGPVGGTSAATPTWASLVALADASPACTSPVGFANPALYGAARTAYAADFNDVTSGNNSYDGVSGYTAGTGYDMASGLGSPKGTALAASLCGTVGDSVSFADAPSAEGSVAGIAITPVTLVATSSRGADPITYSASDLPSGLSINPSTGQISGTPDASGAYPVSVKAQDTDGMVAVTSFTWTVSAPTVTVHGVPSSLRGRVGTPLHTAALSALDSAGALISYTASGLPAGLSINPSTGVISGTPTQAADRTVTITGTDRYGGSARHSFTCVVGGNPRVSSSKLHVSGRDASLTLTLRSGQYAPELKTVRLIAPKGAHFSGRSSTLKRSVRAVHPSGAKQTISRRVSGGRLTVTFTSATSASLLKLSGTELTLSKALASGLVAGTKTLKLTLVVTDASGTQTRVALTLR